MARNKRKVLGILTSGGDCPGLNAVIRAVTKTALNDYGLDVLGYKDGYHGLVTDKFVRLRGDDVSGILSRGGTILGTSNTHDPYRWAETNRGKIVYHDHSRKAAASYRRNKLLGLVIIGGDGTMATAGKLADMGLDIIGVPKTIDNDLAGTDRTFGFDTAVQTAAEAIDKLRDTAQSHHRVMIAEVMGRYAGWLALNSGVAGGADVILIPEIPYDLAKVGEALKARSRRGKRFSILVVAEGAKPLGGQMVVARTEAASPDPVRLGGVGQAIARGIENIHGLDTRVTVLGHLQRGGTPLASDRVLCTRFGVKAAELAAAGLFGQMVALRGNDLVSVPLKQVAGKLSLVPTDHPLIAAARAVGTCFGD
ncbi:MAG: ATP-dependent 6-phosphofructokinase [Elusimicrobia bacterium]|nr:ATP-dependent 6-phosphofructokinase [Elusimicrobiota bacterium]